jgi:hypothetical protein
MPMIRKAYPPVHPTLDEKINRLLAPYSSDNPPDIKSGIDPYLEIAAKAMGITYADAKKKQSKGNVAVLSARQNVKTKLFAIAFGAPVVSS